MTRLTITTGPVRKAPAAGDLRTIRGALHVRRQEVIRDAVGRILGDHVRRGRPVWAWVSIYTDGDEFAGCECRGGPPKDRCDRKWMRCNGRLSEQKRRIKAILAYRDPDAKPVARAAVAYMAPEQGIVDRDLKPANVSVSDPCDGSCGFTHPHRRGEVAT